MVCYEAATQDVSHLFASFIALYEAKKKEKEAEENLSECK